MPRRTAQVRAAALVAMAAISGCGPLALLLNPKVPECEGFDLPVASLATARKQLHVRVKSRGVDNDFPFVVETAPDSFVMIGFTPLGTKSFTLARRGSDVKEENLVGAAQIVPPRNLMADVLAMSLPSQCSPSQDGVVPSVAGEWQVRENCKDGRPLDRKLTKDAAKADEKPDVFVVYQGDAITVNQHQCRYIARYVIEAAPLPVTEPPALPAPTAASPNVAPVAAPATVPAPTPASAPATTAPAATATPAILPVTPTPADPTAPVPAPTTAPVAVPPAAPAETAVPPPATPQPKRPRKSIWGDR